ncbi:MAG TPA: winged helix-turn-helix domain-containing protein [Bacteriovoracaceae bacterium]|nr:winged helix-turn-helix domain-containing protein [Bacteriovoracaceae bacterium]
MAANKILIIEDNADYCFFYEDLLGKENALTMIPSIAKLETHLQLNDLESYDVVLADLLLDDGFFLDWISKTNSNLMEKVPCIIVSSLEDLNILRSSFEWGAADYLIKPFRKNEILAKVEKARRNFVLKPQVELEDRLTSIESRIFRLFSEHIDQHLGREEIISEVWKKVKVEPKTVDVHLSNLRKKLHGFPWTIETDEKGWKLTRTVKLK